MVKKILFSLAILAMVFTSQAQHVEVKKKPVGALFFNASLSNHGAFVAASFYQKGLVSVFEANTGRQMMRIVPEGQNTPPRNIFFDFSDRYILLQFTDKLQVYDINSGLLVTSLTLPEVTYKSSFNAVAGLLTCLSANSEIGIYKFERNALSLVSTRSSKDAMSVETSPDGKYLIASDSLGLTIWPSLLVGNMVRVPVRNLIGFSQVEKGIAVVSKDKLSFLYTDYEGKIEFGPKEYKHLGITVSPSVTPVWNNGFGVLSYNKIVIAAPQIEEYVLKLSESFQSAQYNRARQIFLLRKSEKLVLLSSAGTILTEISSQAGAPFDLFYNKVLEKGLMFSNDLAIFSHNNEAKKQFLGAEYTGISQKNGDWHIVALANGEIQVWSLKEERKLYTVKHKRLPAVVAADAQSKMIYLSDIVDSTIYKYDLSTGKGNAIKKSAFPVTALMAQNGRVITGEADGTVKAIDVSTSATVHQMKIFTDPVSVLASVNGFLLAGSYGRMIRLRNDFSDSTATTVFVGHDGFIQKISVQSSGAYFASVAQGNSIKLWDLQKGNLLKSYNLDSVNVDQVELYDDNSLVASGPNDFVVLEDSVTLRNAQIPPLQLIVQSPNNNRAYKIIISNDGKLMASTDNNVVKVFDLKSGFLLHNLKSTEKVVNGIAFTEDSKMIVVAEGSGIECFDALTGMQLRYINGRSQELSVHDVEAINNSFVAINIHGWHWPTFFHKNSGKDIGYFNFNTSGSKDKLILDLKFSPDKKRVATYGDKFIKLFDASNYKEILAIPRQKHQTYRYSPMDLLDFSSDSKYFLYSDPADGKVHIHNTATGALIKSHGGELAKFGSNAIYIYAIGSILYLANVTDNTELKLKANADINVNCLAYNAKENIFAAGDAFGNIKLLEGNNGTLIRAIDRWDQYTYNAFLSPDKRHVLFNNRFGLYTFDLKTLNRYRLPGKNYPFTAAFSPFSDRVYFQMDKDVFEADHMGQNERKLFSVPDSIENIEAVNVSEDGKVLYFTAENDMFYFYDIQSGKQIYKINSRAINGYSLISPTRSLKFKDGNYSLQINAFQPSTGRMSITPALLTLANLQVTQLAPEKHYSDKDWKYSDIGNARREYDLAVFELSLSRRYFAFIDPLKFTCEIRDLTTDRIVFTRRNPPIDNITRLIFDPAEKYFILTFKGGSIEVFDLTKPEASKGDEGLFTGFDKVVTISGNENGINGISLQKDLLLVTGSNSMLSVFDMSQRGEIVFSAVFVRDRDQVLIDKEGYYYSTKNSSRYLAFKKGAEIYPFDRFDYLQNRPDKIMEALQSQGLTSPELVEAFANAYRKRMQRSSAQIVDMSSLPQLTIEDVNLKQVSYTQEITVPVSARSSGVNLSKIHIVVNGVPQYGSGGYSINGKTFVKKIPMFLSIGENIIRVTVEDENKVQSYPVSLAINYTPTQPQKPNLHLITMSVSDYLGDTDLKYATKDGRDMVSQFKKSNKYGQVFIDTLFNQMATRENFLALKAKLLKTRTDDHVILFLSGHGLLDKKYDFYFATYDCDFKDPSRNGLAYKEIEGLLDSIPARKKLLFMDACHSGEFDKESEELGRAMGTGVLATLAGNKKGVEVTNSSLGLSNAFLLMKDLFSNLDRVSGTVVISAAAGDSYALESDTWKNGVFTYSILSGISDLSADLDKNRSITASELREYVYKKVTEETGGRQKPSTREENFEYDWVVW